MDGEMVARAILDSAAQRVNATIDKTGVKPCLATVLVGDDPASVTYTRMKRKRCELIGMRSLKVKLPGDSTTQQLVDRIT